METVVARLLHSPKLFFYYQELHDAVEQEQARRRQFYATMTEQEKIEFINGEIVRQSPVTIEHDFASGNLYALLRTYVMFHDLGYVGHEKMLVSLTRNDYEPDVCYWRKATADAFRKGQMHFPAPDFVAEVLSPSTTEIDRHTKFKDYAAHGVQEYWIIDPVPEVVEQYILRGKRYELIQKTDSGMLRSPVVEGFQIPAVALFKQAEYLRMLREITGN